MSEQWKDAPRGDPRLASVERSADHEYIEIVKVSWRSRSEVERGGGGGHRVSNFQYSPFQYTPTHSLLLAKVSARTGTKK